MNIMYHMNKSVNVRNEKNYTLVGLTYVNEESIHNPVTPLAILKDESGTSLHAYEDGSLFIGNCKTK